MEHAVEPLPCQNIIGTKECPDYRNVLFSEDEMCLKILGFVDRYALLKSVPSRDGDVFYTANHWL